MLASIIRTAVPVIAGVLLGWAAKIGLDLPSGAVTEIVTAVLTTAYYAAGPVHRADLAEPRQRPALPRAGTPDPGVHQARRRLSPPLAPIQ